MGTISVIVGRMDNNKRIEVEQGTTIGNAFRQGGYSKAENEVIQDIKTVEHTEDEDAVNGVGYFFVARVKSGC